MKITHLSLRSPLKISFPRDRKWYQFWKSKEEEHIFTTVIDCEGKSFAEMEDEVEELRKKLRP